MNERARGNGEFGHHLGPHKDDDGLSAEALTAPERRGRRLSPKRDSYMKTKLSARRRRRAVRKARIATGCKLALLLALLAVLLVALVAWALGNLSRIAYHLIVLGGWLIAVWRCTALQPPPYTPDERARDLLRWCVEQLYRLEDLDSGGSYRRLQGLREAGSARSGHAGREVVQLARQAVPGTRHDGA
jgi:hypothetical protein